MEKNFNEWNALKAKLDTKNLNINFKERDIWWCSIGLNIGHEENGKSQFFSRPVLVVRKFNKNLFFGIPLTTKIKENKFYYKISFKDGEQCAMLSQLKIFESKRMRSRMGDLSHKQFDGVRKKLAEMILGG